MECSLNVHHIKNITVGRKLHCLGHNYTLSKNYKALILTHSTKIKIIKQQPMNQISRFGD